MAFEHYLQTTKTNPMRIKLLTAAGVMAISGTFAVLMFGWVAGKMSIARVAPPTVDFIIVQMTAEEPPPPPPPPPPPAGGEVEEEEEEEEIPEEEEPIEELLQPDDKPKDIPDEKKSSGAIPKGVPGGMPGGVPGGVPGGAAGIKTKSTDKGAVTKQPLSAVMAQAVFTPDPDDKLLQATKAARFDKRDGDNITSFCIDTNGKVVDVKTKQKFPNDPQVDKIIADTVKKWRFKPFVVGSKPVKTCSERKFRIKFNK
jgi:protein TonB